MTDWADVGRNLERAWRPVLAALHGQAALAHVLHADLDKARESLGRLQPDQLQELSVAAAALSSLADEVAAGQPGGQP